MLQEGDDLFKFLLCFCHAGHVVEFDAGFRFHHEAGLTFAELHGLARTTGHAAVAASQEDQGANQKQWEQQIAKKAKGWGCCLRRVDIKADALLFKGIDQLRCQTGKVDANALDFVVQIRVSSFNNRIASTVIDIDGSDPASFDVIKEAAVAHA